MRYGGLNKPVGVTKEGWDDMGEANRRGTYEERVARAAARLAMRRQESLARARAEQAERLAMKQHMAAAHGERTGVRGMILAAAALAAVSRPLRSMPDGASFSGRD